VLDLHADAVPRKPSASAPPTELALLVPNPLKDTEWVGVLDGEPEEERLTLGEKELLTEELCEEARVAHCVVLML
jgi:hypothetical protein